VPLFGLKLLAAIVESNPAFLGIMKKLNLIQVLIEYFEVSHPKLNRHTIKIFKNIVESPEISIEELNKLGIVEKVSRI
jgi:hypothetical protein